MPPLFSNNLCPVASILQTLTSRIMKNRTIPFLLALVLAPLFAQGHGIIIIDHPL